MMGAGFLLVAIASIVGNLRFLRRSVATAGTVVKVVHGQGEYRGSISVTVAFSLPDEREIRFVAQGNPLYRRLTSGDAVPVRYEPANPSAARIPYRLSLWGTELLFILFAAIALGIFFHRNGLQAFTTG